MMSEQQKKTLALLTEICELSPDIRVGQLFAHLGLLGEIHCNRSLGDIDDNELAHVLDIHRKELQDRFEEPLNHSSQRTEIDKTISPGSKVA